MSDETTIWEGHSSQVLNLPVFLWCSLLVGVLLGCSFLVGAQTSTLIAWAVAATAIIPIMFALHRALQIKCRRYQVTTQRLRIRQGILSKRTDEVELYRVRDYVVLEPFALRLFGLSNLALTTDDSVNPLVVLQAIPDAAALKDQVRTNVEICRDKKRVRVAELEGGFGSESH